MSDKPATETTTETVLSRSQLRGKIFSAKTEKKTVNFMGAEVELRQPGIGQVLEARQAFSDDLKRGTVNMLIKYTYVPGSDEKVFEEADFDAILELPFNADFNNLSSELNKLMGLSIEVSEVALEGAAKSD